MALEYEDAHDNLQYLPVVTQGPYWKHVAEGWEKRDHPNVLFLFYEDLKEDIMREMRRLNAFLGTGYTDEQLLKVAEHTKFSNMKSRSTTNPTEAAVKVGRFKAGEGEFVRKGWHASHLCFVCFHLSVVDFCMCI